MPYSLRIVCGFFNVPQLFTRVVRRDLRLIVLFREDLKVKPFADAITKAVIFKTLSVGPAGVELTTSGMTTRCSINCATGARSTQSTLFTQVRLQEIPQFSSEHGKRIKLNSQSLFIDI